MDVSAVDARLPHDAPARWSLSAFAATPEGAALVATALASLVFLAWPALDIGISAAFFDGRAFPLADAIGLRLLRRSSTWALGLGLVAALIMAVRAFLLRRQGQAANWRGPVFVLTGLLMGPGLVVNLIFKSLWGRPRPVHLAMFGGDADYEPVWRISRACLSNCSFVSGEASSAAWLCACLVLVPPRWRPLAAPIVIAYAVSLSLNRIAFGGHFVSDVVLSWSLTALILALVHRFWRSVPFAPPVVRMAVQPA